MSIIFFARVDLDVKQALESLQVTSPATRERFLVFGALCLVTLLLILWALFIRKKRRRRRKHHHSHHRSSQTAEALEAPKDDPLPAAPEQRRRSRRSRRRHRPRNPTLAETGGLPPLRPEDPFPPAS